MPLLAAAFRFRRRRPNAAGRVRVSEAARRRHFSVQPEPGLFSGLRRRALHGVRAFGLAAAGRRRGTFDSSSGGRSMRACLMLLVCSCVSCAPMRSREDLLWLDYGETLAEAEAAFEKGMQNKGRL